MRRYLLNSAVITSEGVYEYRLISKNRARVWYTQGTVESAIGYVQTALALSEILADSIMTNRKMIKMEKGDEALVFRLVFPSGSGRIDPSDKGKISEMIMKKNFELGLLRRIR